MKAEPFPAESRLLIALALLLLGSLGCAGGRPGPTVQAEFRPPRPERRAVWVPGHWEWVDRERGYRWVEGHWRTP
jgi:hypothetical protein